MLIEKRFNENKESIKKRKEILNYIALIKFMSMILIIRWHIYKWKYPIRIDYGARMCEFLFVSSGFLIGYNYNEITMPATYHTSCKYTYKHLRSFYPLHIINSLYEIHIRKRNFNLILILLWVLMESHGL